MFKYNYGFLIARVQPMHLGHISLIDKMLYECKYATIILGSIQEERTKNNPFSFQEREKMFRNIYKDKERIKVFGIKDYKNKNGWDNDAWLNAICDILDRTKNQFGIPNAFYCGGYFEGHWFEDWDLDIVLLDREKQPSKLQISATEIREKYRNNDNTWKQLVPKENLNIIENIFKKIL